METDKTSPPNLKRHFPNGDKLKEKVYKFP